MITTLLDAHPDVAMSYETYEHLLKPDQSNTYELPGVLEKIQKNPLNSIERIFFSGTSDMDANFKKFLARSERSDIDRNILDKLFKKHFAEGLSLDTFRDRMFFVERLSREKMQSEGKKYWGTKITSKYNQLDELYPEARYMFMLRDGRDIAASRKTVGDFNQTIEHIADGWCKQIKKFEEFASSRNDRAFYVHYENLAHDPENELRALMDKIGLPWSERLLNYHDLNLSIHRHPTGHLSGKQVKSPVNTSSIGRWKKDLTRDEIERFEAKAGDMLKKLGYMTQRPLR